jgi:PST family polysaccharide transporter
VARSVNALVQIGSVLFLARLLSPEDYGLVGMVAAITGFAPLLVDLGSRDAIVQRPRITGPRSARCFGSPSSWASYSHWPWRAAVP